MRDILLAAFILGLIPLILRNATVGTFAWAWFSMMNPHRMTFGFAQSIPFALILAITTLLAFAASKQRRPLPINSVTVVQMLLLFWMGVTSIFALNSTDVVLERVIFFGKIQLMLFVTMMLVRGRKDIERLIWVVTFSIGFYGIKGGVWTVLSGGGNRVYGPTGTMLEENNGLAVALVMVLPFMAYLYQVSTHKLMRWALMACMVFTGFSILGSQSRGAFLALTFMVALLGFKSRYPVRATVVLACLVLVAVAFMPDTWKSRMESVQTYQEDSSAMSRLYTWQTLWNLAIDRPIIGAGFRTDSAAIFAKYAPFDGSNIFENEGIFVAHSIYFQALGEHGFPGLLLFLLLGIVAWRKAGKLARLTKNDPEFGTWVPLLMPMTQVSLIGFAVGGAFLSMMQFDFPYYIVCYVVLVDTTVRDSLAQRPKVISPGAVFGARPYPVQKVEQP